jgi:hypothetical protein
MNDKGIRHSSLKEWFAEIFDNRHKDAIEHLLVLTYEFDDQQLVNLVTGRSLEEDYQIRLSQLKIIARLRPVVIYDSQKTREFNSLPHFLELYPVHNSGFSCHHSKAYLLITAKSIRLLIGSCNLTRTGMFRNREVYNDFLWNKESLENSNVLRSFSEILERGYTEDLGKEGANAVAPIINNIRIKMGEWSEGGNKHTDNHSLLISGYTGYPTGLEQLKSLWGSRKLRKLFVVSPFFDQGNHVCLAHEICREIGTPEELCIITDEKSMGTISKYHFDKSIGGKSLRLIPAEISPSERDRIQRANNNRSVKDLALERPLHAKILVLVGDKEGLVYQGSANFSCKAWKGQNRELGIVHWDSNPEVLIADIYRELGAGKENVYDLLQEQLKKDESIGDEENPEPDSTFQFFVKRIVLHSKTDDSGTKVVWFELSAADNSRLSSYDISWGKNPIAFKEGISGTIPQKKFFADLIGNRNLRFTLKSNPEKYYFLPFIYSESIHAEKEVIVYPDSNDWLDFYLGLQEEPLLQLGEAMPGEGNGMSSHEDYDTLNVDRESNIVISMQHYLDKFSRVEKNFINMAGEISRLREEDKEKQLDQQILDPMETLCKILEREWKDSLDHSSYLFKTGELVLLTHKIAKIIPRASRLIKILLSYIPKEAFKKDETFQLYREYIEKGNITEIHANT